MLKHEKIITSMSLKQKIEMIVSKNKYQSGEVEGYKIPNVKLLNHGDKYSVDKEYLTLPNDRTLVSSWNDDLIEEVFSSMGKELLLKSPYDCILTNSSLEDNGVSDNSYLTSRFLLDQMNGLNKAHTFTCFEDKIDSFDDNEKKIESELPEEVIRNNTKYNWVIVNNIESLKKYKKDNDIDFYFANVYQKDEIGKYLNKNVSLLFLCYDGYEEAIEYIVELTKKYENESAKLKNRIINNSFFNKEIENGEIVSENKIDELCDGIIELLSAIREKNEDAQNQLDELNEIMEDLDDDNHQLAIKSATESIVLLKNESNTLPLIREKKAVFIGDWMKEESYVNENLNNKPIHLTNSFNEIEEECNINYIGYSHGYIKGDDGSNELVASSVELAKEADVAVLYLYNENNEDTLPQKELDLIDKVSEVCPSVVAIIISEKMVDLSFETKCQSILYVNGASEGTHRAILDILNGTAPSGHLARTWPIMNGCIVQGNDSVSIDQIPYMYPFGYGLSYGRVEYTNLVVTEKGITITLINIGDFKASEVVQMYIQSDDSECYNYKKLRGYKKVFLQPKESVKIDINFDKYTFRQYIENKKCYGVKKGIYKVILGSSFDDERMLGEIQVRDNFENYFEIHNEVEEIDSNDEIQRMITNVRKVDNSATYKKKIILSSILLGYFDISLILLEVYFIITIGFDTFAIMILSIFLIFTLMMVLHIVSLAKNKKKEEIQELSLSMVVNSMKNYGETNPIKYEVTEVFEEETPQDNAENIIEETNEPLENEEAEEQQVEETPVTEETQEGISEEIPEDLDQLVESTSLSEEEIRQHEEEEMKIIEEQNLSTLFTEEDEEEEIEYDTDSSLHEVCNNFAVYASNRGLTIEAISIKSIFGALASSKVIILNTKDMATMPKFIEILNEYLGSKIQTLHASSNFISPFNLAWQKNDNGDYEKTAFITDIYKAGKNKNNINLAIIDNVDMNNAMLYTQEIIKFANSPKVYHSLTINNNVKINIPDNLSFVLIPTDEQFINKIPFELAKASIVVELLMRESEVCEDKLNVNALSYSYFKEIVDDAKKTNYLSEESWKKIDELVDGINKMSKFVLSNKETIQIERFVSIMLDCGSNEADTLDCIVSEKIIPSLISQDFAKQEQNNKKLMEIIENTFGEDDQMILRVFKSGKIFVQE